MDTQLKRGLLDICVLAATQKEDSYGYRIIRDVRPYIAISESTLYPILRRLENAACLQEYTVEHEGRLRKYYHLTEQGRARLRDFAADWQEMQRICEFISGKEAKHE